MTIEEAIKILDPETTREALSACCDKGEAIRVVEKACETACAALRAQLEAEKDGRRRYCAARDVEIRSKMVDGDAQTVR